MIGDLWMNIRNEHKKGLSISEIAKKYALIESKPKYTKKLKRKSKLNPYKEIVNTLLEEASYSAVRVYEKIQELGYTGKIGIVRSYVSSKKKELTNKATARFETLPGKQAQVDWAHCGSFIEENDKKTKI